MKIIINPDNLIPDEKWQYYYKVRAIIENENGEFIISHESGKYIFPGGKREKSETNINAIKREIKEETGIDLKLTDFKEVLELITLYKDYYNFRSKSNEHRYTSTIYYYARISEKIAPEKMRLTADEISQKFKIAFVKKEKLIKLLMEDHSNAMNGKFFDAENQIVINNILKV